VARIRTQLAIQAPPELLERLRLSAAVQRRTVTALVLEAIETALSGGPAEPAASAELLMRVAALEEAVARLQRPASPERVIDLPRSGEGLSTVELARLTGTNRAAWNNWAAKASPGEVRRHPQAGNWRLVGKAATAGGGPARWLWEQAKD
jgi:predicted transcriptional regulator